EGLEPTSGQEGDDPGDPDRSRDGVQKQELETPELHEAQVDVATFASDVREQLQEGKVMPHLPDESREEDDEGDGPAEEEPSTREESPVWRQQEPRDQREAEEDDRKLVQETDPAQQPEPEP